MSEEESEIAVSAAQVPPVADSRTNLASYAPTSRRARFNLDQIAWDSFSGMKHIHGFNYQPSWGCDAPSVWLENFNVEKYRLELETGRRYFPAFNCVRIWLGYGAYRTNPQLLVRHFNQAVRVCTDLELLIIPVLFTVWGGDPPFDPVSVPALLDTDFEKAYGSYLRDLIAPQRGNRSILAWDLCNEPTESDGLNPVHQRQVVWLKFLHDRVKTLDPAARACIGTVSDFAWGQTLADYCDILTPHLYGYSIWKPAFDRGQVRADFETWFECMVDQYVLRTALLSSKPKPILSTETCWGARSDMQRKRIIEATLTVLRRHNIGFLPHALHTSGVADLHLRDEFRDELAGSIENPASMAFVNADGQLRPGHDVFNDYCSPLDSLLSEASG